LPLLKFQPSYIHTYIHTHTRVTYIYWHAEFQNLELFEVTYERSAYFSLGSKQNDILSFSFSSLFSVVFPNVITNTSDIVKALNQMYGTI